MRVIILGFVSLILSLACYAQSATELNIRSGDTFHQFDVEVADTDELITLGLSNRDSLAENAGVLFDFGSNSTRPMSMQGIALHLDILFINQTGKILAIARNAVPQSERPIGIGAPLRAVLELNADTANSLGILPGDTVIHPLFGNLELAENPAE